MDDNTTKTPEVETKTSRADIMFHAAFAWLAALAASIAALLGA